MPQTKFVTSKALALGLRPIVVVNKVDKPDGEPDRALDECFDLFANLDASDDQLDFPNMYASGRSGWADMELDGPRAKQLLRTHCLIYRSQKQSQHSQLIHRPSQSPLVSTTAHWRVVTVKRYNRGLFVNA